jgi:hypothetical protein
MRTFGQIMMIQKRNLDNHIKTKNFPELTNISNIGYPYGGNGVSYILDGACSCWKGGCTSGCHGCWTQGCHAVNSCSGSCPYLADGGGDTPTTGTTAIVDIGDDNLDGNYSLSTKVLAPKPSTPIKSNCTCGGGCNNN